MDKQQFVAKVTAREQTLYRVARSMLRNEADEQDAVQEAVLKAWAKRNTLREERYFATWLVRILINECKSIHRKQSRLVLMATWVEDSLGESHADMHGELDAMLDTLPERLRLPVVLHYVEGFPVKDIASMLHCPQGTIKKRLFDARKALRLELEQEKEAWQR